MGNPSVAALQVALHDKGLYESTVDGLRGPATTAAVRRFQRRAGLAVDGIAGPHTRRALGRFGRPGLGARILRMGRAGWDVAALQFDLAWHGCPSGNFDGVFGPETESAVVTFQRSARIAADGVVGPQTLSVLRRPLSTVPFALSRPVRARISSTFGPRGDRFHEGVDLAASFGTPVRAAARGVVVFAGWNDGFGRLVVVRSRADVSIFYAHLSAIDVSTGEPVGIGRVLGRVGESGEATGPHLHFEVRVRSAAVNPLSRLR